MPISNFPLIIPAPITAVDLQELTTDTPPHPQTLHGHNLYPYAAAPLSLPCASCGEDQQQVRRGSDPEQM